MSWYNPATWFVDQESVAAGQAADVKLAELDKKYQPGGRIYERIEAEQGTAAADATLEQVLEHRVEYASPTLEAVETDVTNAFESGWNDAWEERKKQLGSLLEIPGNTIIKVIPWYWWIIGAGVLFFYLGGGPWLKKQLKW